MEAALAANEDIQSRYTKDKKVGEGTYAVVYLGAFVFPPPRLSCRAEITSAQDLIHFVFIIAYREGDRYGEEDRHQKGSI